MSPVERDAWMQDRYAAWLDALTRIAFVLSTVSFALYVTGTLAPWVPPADLPTLWHLPLEQYLAHTSAPTGWGWLGYVARGDYLNYVGLSLFACVVVVCHLAILVPLLRRGERLMAGLVVAQVLVLSVAASGVVG